MEGVTFSDGLSGLVGPGSGVAWCVQICSFVVWSVVADSCLQTLCGVPR